MTFLQNLFSFVLLFLFLVSWSFLQNLFSSYFFVFLSSGLFDFLWFSGQVLPGPWMTGHFSTIWPNGHPSLQSGHNWLKTSPPNYFCGVISHNNTFPKIIMTNLMMILWCRWSTDPAVPFPLPNASSSLSTPRQRSKIFENQHQHHQHQHHANVLNF